MRSGYREIFAFFPDPSRSIAVLEQDKYVPGMAYYSRRRPDAAAIPPCLRRTQCMRDIRSLLPRVYAYIFEFY